MYWECNWCAGCKGCIRSAIGMQGRRGCIGSEIGVQGVKDVLRV